MQDIEKASNSLKETINHLRQRLDILLPSSLCSGLHRVLIKQVSEEPVDFASILSTIMEQVRETQPVARVMSAPKGKAVEYLNELINFYKDFIILLEEGITKKINEFLNTFVKKFHEQRKKASGEFSAGLGDSVHTLKTLNANFPSFEVKQMLSSLVHDEHKLQLGLILILSLSFSLYLRSNPLLQRNPPKNMFDLLPFIDKESLESTCVETELSQEILRTCFIEILSPLIESGIQGVKGTFHFDMIIEYFTLIGFLLDSYSGITLYSTLVRRGLAQVPIISAIRVLVACFMKSPSKEQKKCYADYLIYLLTEKQSAVPALLDTVLNTKWPVLQARSAVGKIVASAPATNTNYYLNVVMHIFKAIYFVKPISIKDKMNLLNKAKGRSTDESQIALFLLGKILEAQPELGKKIIVRKFLLKFYDLGLIDLETLKRDSVISDTGNKFRNMDKKGFDIRALTKDVKLFVRFISMLEHQPEPFFDCMAECSYAIFDLYVKLDKGLYKNFYAALAELLKIYLSSEDPDPFQGVIAMNILSYMLHDVTDYLDHLKALVDHLLAKPLPLREPDPDGLGNSALTRVPPKGAKLSMAAICKCIKAYADKKRDKVKPIPSEENSNSKSEACAPYSFSNEAGTTGNEIMFIKNDTRALIEGGYFSLSMLHKTIERNNEVLELLLSFKGSPKASRVLKDLFIEVLKMIVDIKNGVGNQLIDLCDSEEYADKLTRMLGGEKPAELLEEVADNKERVKEFSIAILLSVVEKIVGQAALEALLKGNEDVIGVIVYFLEQMKNDKAMVKIGLTTLIIGIKSSLEEGVEGLVTLRFTHIEHVVEEITKMYPEEDIKGFTDSILHELKPYTKDQPLKSITEDLDQELYMSYKKGISGIKYFIGKYKGFLPVTIHRTVQDYLLKIPCAKSEEKAILVKLWVELCEIDPKTTIRRIIQELKECVDMTLLQAIIYAVKKGKIEVLTGAERLELLSWTLEQKANLETNRLLLDLAGRLPKFQAKNAEINTVLEKLAILTCENPEEEVYLQIMYEFGTKMSEDITRETGKSLQERLEKLATTTQNKLVAHYCSTIKTDIIDKVLSYQIA